MLAAAPMKHWDGRDLADASPAELSPRDRQRIGELFQAPPRRRSRETPIGSVIGLVSALAILGFMTWALMPGSPVSPDLMQ
jgi:hypothetical protein